MHENLIVQALSAAGLAPVARMRKMGSVIQLTLSDESQVVAKVARGSGDALTAEHVGLERLSQAGWPVVASHGVHHDAGWSVLLTEFAPAGRVTTDGWAAFGTSLAHLHETAAGARYGFEQDNFIGLSPQWNDWADEWTSFNRDHRIGYQLDRAVRAGHVNAEQHRIIQRVLERLDQFLPRHPVPAVLHGDLWSGNVVETEGNRVLVIDPAVYVGDGWADIAMMKLFGGFPQACHDAYAAVRGDSEPERVQVYQLYHLLNHVNIFGRSYLDQTMACARALV